MPGQSYQIFIIRLDKPDIRDYSLIMTVKDFIRLGEKGGDNNEAIWLKSDFEVAKAAEAVSQTAADGVLVLVGAAVVKAWNINAATIKGIKMFDKTFKVQIIGEKGKVVAESTVGELTTLSLKWASKQQQGFFGYSKEEAEKVALAEKAAKAELKAKAANEVVAKAKADFEAMFN